MVVRTNLLWEKLRRGEMALGLSLRQIRTADAAFIAEAAGFDWLMVDGEHTAVGLDDACNITTAACGTNVTPVVRVNRKDDALMTRYLDNGALGILVPHVDTAEDAQFIVDRCKFAPIGKRSISRQHPASGFELLKITDFTEWCNRETMVICMLESPQGIENVDAIAAVEGVDAIFIGAGDLSYEMGIPGQMEHPRIREAYEAVFAACRKHGKIPAMAGIRDKALIPGYLEMGARFILADQDLRLMLAAGKETTKFYRDAAAAQ